MSAAASLIARALRLKWNNAASIRLPALTMPTLTWVKPGIRFLPSAALAPQAPPRSRT